MNQLYDNYLETSLVGGGQCEWKIKQLEVNYRRFFPVTGQMSTHFQILTERRKKDPSVRDFAVDEYAPIYHAAKETPYMKFYCGDSLCDWPARVEENQLLVMRMRRVYGNQNVSFYSIPGATHGSCTAPSLAMINYELVRVARKITGAGK